MTAGYNVVVARKQAILITGSGRCGTSLVAEVFFKAGFPMGRESELLAHQNVRGSQSGYWEHVRIQDLNRKILEVNGVNWHNPIKPSPLSLTTEVRNEIRSMAGRLPDGFCSKDPRYTWTADLWSE